MNEFNEPWKIQPYSGTVPNFRLLQAIGHDGEADKVFLAVGSEVSPEHAISRAARVVACVNALAGVPTEDIEQIVKLGKIRLKIGRDACDHSSIFSTLVGPNTVMRCRKCGKLLADSPKDAE